MQQQTVPPAATNPLREIQIRINRELEEADQRPLVPCHGNCGTMIADISFVRFCDACIASHEVGEHKKEQRELFRERQKNGGLPKEFYTARLSEYNPEAAPAAGPPLDKLVIEQRRAVLQKFNSYDSRSVNQCRGTLLAGPPGTGKTLLTAALFNRFCYTGESPLWLDGRSLDYQITAEWKKTQRDNPFGTRLAEEIANYKIIFIEDLQITSEKPYDWYIAALNDIINEIWVRKNLLFVTTNHRRYEQLAHDRDQDKNKWLQKAYGPSFVSRLNGMCQILPLSGPDMRALQA